MASIFATLDGLSPILIGIASGALIAIGVALVTRDLARARRASFARATAAGVAGDAAAMADVTISGRDADATGSPARGVSTRVAAALPRASGGPGLAALQSAIAGIESESDDQAAASERASWVESRWTTSEPMLALAAERLNGVVAPVGLAIGPAGERGWSFKNRGYGAYRRIFVNGESVAWLRIELAATGTLSVKVRAHKDEQALLNSATSVGLAGITEAAVVDALARSLKPIAEFAAWTVPRRTADAEAGKAAWDAVSEPATAALVAANGALAQAGAHLSPLAGPRWEPAIARFRWPVGVEVGSEMVALMHVECIGEVLEVSVGVPDPERGDLGRRRRIDTAGITPHAIAELMASSAWPAIADKRGRAPFAGVLASTAGEPYATAYAAATTPRMGA